MSELTSVAILTGTVLKQKSQEYRRELKRRVEALRTHLWTILEVLDNDQPSLPPTVSLMDYAREIDSLVSQICTTEQMLEQLKCSQVRKLTENPRVRERVQAIDDLRKKQENHIGVPA